MIIEIVRAVERLVVASCIPILLIIGYQLFVRGATGDIKLSARMDRWQGKATNIAPGGLCFLLAVALPCYVLSSTVPATTAQSSGGDSGSTESTVHWLGGSGSKRNVVLGQLDNFRRDLSELAACQNHFISERLMSDDIDGYQCRDRYFEQYSRVPTERELALLQDWRQRAAQGDDDAMENIVNYLASIGYTPED